MQRLERRHQLGQFARAEQVVRVVGPPAQLALRIQERFHQQDPTRAHLLQNPRHASPVKIIEDQNRIKNPQRFHYSAEVHHAPIEREALLVRQPASFLHGRFVPIHRRHCRSQRGGGQGMTSGSGGHVQHPRPGTDQTGVPGEPGAGPGGGWRGGQGHSGRSSERAGLDRLQAGPVDVLVIGGGIVGTGVARDAALRGFRTALVDQFDLGWGTSSRSSRLIHGGLRYLEQGHLGLVAEAVRERGVLLHIAPHLVWPLPFTFPVHRGGRLSRWKLAAGLWLYDLLSLFRNVPRHRMLGKRALLESEPTVRERGLTGGARYWDAQCNDVRLVIANARSAIYSGAMVANYMAVRSLATERGRVVGAMLEDRHTGERGVVRAGVVINATGPWVDRLRAMETPGAPALLRATKGVHLMIPRDRLGLRSAVTFTSRVDGRVMFALPWGDHAYIGTTDTDTLETPESVAPTGDDLVYLLRSANAEFPGAHLTFADVVSTWAGLRPLVADDARGGDADTISREHVIIRGTGGMITVAGGKLTTYRSMAAQVVDRAARELKILDGRAIPPRAPTDTEPLVGGEVKDLVPFRERGLEAGLGPATVEHLIRHYGTESAGIYNLGLQDRKLFRRLHPEHPAVEAEVLHAGRRELARTVEDVLVRRIRLYQETADRGERAARRTAELLARVLGWDEQRTAEETAAYLAFIDGARG